MLIVDTQVHIWSNAMPVRFHRQVPKYTKEELLHEMDEAGVAAAVIHPPSWDPKSNALAIEAAAAHPNRLAILGSFDVANPSNRSLIETWKRQPGMLGLRFPFVNPGEENRLVDGTMDWLWPAAERAGVPISLWPTPELTAPNRCRVVGEIAAKYPGLRILIDHMDRPREAQDDTGFANLSELLALAKYPNVAVKATGVPSYSSQPYPYRNIHKYLEQVFYAFGPKRMFWGTDITRMPCSWRQCITMFTEELPWLKGDDLKLVMGGSLCDWLGWKLPPEMSADGKL